MIFFYISFYMYLIISWYTYLFFFTGVVIFSTVASTLYAIPSASTSILSKYLDVHYSIGSSSKYYFILYIAILVTTIILEYILSDIKFIGV